jgi:integrase
VLVCAADGISVFLKVYRLARSSSCFSEGEGLGLSLAVVRDLRVARAPVTPDDLVALETDVLAGFVLARAAAGLADSTIASDVVHLEQVRAWFGRALWELEPADADVYFGKVLRETAKGTRLSRAQALKTFFLFLELRHKVEIHQMTGRVVECPIDEMNRPRGRQRSKLRIPPTAVQVHRLFAGWRKELATCRKFAPAARNYAACRLLAEVGLRVNEACMLDLGDIKWDLGPLRQAPRPSWQGRSWIGASRAHGAADQRCRGDAALVCPGRVGAVR